MSPEPMSDELRAEADLYADYETEHADLIRRAADLIDRLSTELRRAQAESELLTEVDASLGLSEHYSRSEIPAKVRAALLAAALPGDPAATKADATAKIDELRAQYPMKLTQPGDPAEPDELDVKIQRAEIYQRGWEAGLVIGAEQASTCATDDPDPEQTP